MADIFISYTASDRDWAFWIAEELKAAGHVPHVHEWEIGAGDDIYAWMEARHDAADHVLCVVSDDYLKAPYSTLERNAAIWQAASARPGFVIFVVVKPCRLPTLTDHVRRCELFGIDDAEARRRFRDFMAARSAPGTILFPGQVYALSNIPIRVPAHFLGRGDALDAIDAGLSRYEGRVAVTALHGLRGVGKTTLAAAYAEKKRADYRATWWIRAETPEGMRADLVALGVRLGWIASDTREEVAFAAVLERLGNEGEGILLVYDNAIDAAALRPFLPRGGGARVLVTSNSHAWRGIAEPVEIRLWPKEIGADYLVARTGDPDERSVAETLSDALGGLPLAHEQAAAYCERLSVRLSDYLRRFEAQPGRLLDDARHAPADYHDGLTVAKTFALAIDEATRLHPAAELLLSVAALLPPEPIPLFLFADGREAFALAPPGSRQTLADLLADDGLDEMLAALATFALVDRETVPDERDPAVKTACFRLHRLVRQVAQQPDGGERKAALVRALEMTYPPDAFDDPKTWSRCRRLNASALAVMEDRGLDASPVAAALANLLDAMGKFRFRTSADHDLIRSLFERALAIRERAFGPDHPVTANTLNTIASLLLRGTGEYAAARAMLERALAIREKELGPDHTHTTATLNNLATVTMDMGDLPAARALYERALAARERSLGEDNRETATSTHNLAGVLYAMGEYQPARKLYERTLAIRERLLGSDHPGTAMTTANLSLLLQSMGDYAAAHPLSLKALAAFEKTLGPEHPQTAMSLGNLGSLLSDMGDRPAARPLFERALAIDEKAAGANHPATAASLANLGTLLMAMDDLHGARPLLERALDIRRSALGDRHADTAASFGNLAMLLRRIGDRAAARPLYGQAVAMSAATLGERHANTARLRAEAARLDLDDGRIADALAGAEAALKDLDAALGPAHAWTKSAAGLAADALAALGRDAGALKAKHGLS